MLTDDPAPQRLARPVRNYAQMPRFQRVKVSVLGRYMLADRSEFPCQVLEMSPGDAAVIAPVAGSVGLPISITSGESRARSLRSSMAVS